MDDKQKGGLTGATGSLTPSDPDDEFVPAETREMNDPAARRDSTSVHRRAEDAGAEDAGAEDAGAEPEPGPGPPAGEPTLGGDERREPEDEHL